MNHTRFSFLDAEADFWNHQIYREGGPMFYVSGTSADLHALLPHLALFLSADKLEAKGRVTRRESARICSGRQKPGLSPAL